MKVFLDSIGCRLNQSEIEKLASQFRMAGHTIVPTAEAADLVVINTCTVTSAAASDSRQKIRQASRGQNRQIIVTGCWATLEPDTAHSLPAVIKVVPNSKKSTLVGDFLEIDSGFFDLEPLVRDSLPGVHRRTRAFIKTQDGCDNACTYCITRLARGKSQSEPSDTILGDIQRAVAGGVREVVLTGVHLGSWGHEFTPRAQLSDLIKTILAQTDLERLRLSSLEPWDLNEEFFQLWENERLCPHLHLPLQSGCSRTLKRMARNTTPQAYNRLIEMARAVRPNMGITTDIIVGFPGETDDDFEESLRFVKSMSFSGGHIFGFSPRPGTAAEKYDLKVPNNIIRERSKRMRSVISQSAEEFRTKMIGSIAEVLWETTKKISMQDWHMHGWSGNYVRVETIAQQPLWNQISCVRLMEVKSNGMVGELIEPSVGDTYSCDSY